jgi:hypothetical protein
LERPWKDIKEEVKEELFRLCRSLLLENRDQTLDDLKRVLKQWFTFCDGNDGRSKNDGESADETNASVTLDDISLFCKLIDEAIDVCRRHNFTDNSFGKSATMSYVLLKKTSRNLYAFIRYRGRGEYLQFQI